MVAHLLDDVLVVVSHEGEANSQSGGRAVEKHCTEKSLLANGVLKPSLNVRDWTNY